MVEETEMVDIRQATNDTVSSSDDSIVEHEDDLESLNNRRAPV